MSGFLEKYSRESKILLLSLAVQTVVFFILFSLAASRGLEFTEFRGDARAYQVLAENIVGYRVFSLSPSAPFSPESFRSPGYPLFLAALLLTTRSWFITLFIQGLLVSFAPLLLYCIGKRLHERAAFAASIFFIFEPARLFLSNSLLTDAFFTLILFVSLFILFNLQSSYGHSILSGVLLGTSALIRPIALYLPLVFVPFLWFIQSRPKEVEFVLARKRKIGLVVLFLVGFFVSIFPWSLRNKILFDSWQLSSVASSNLATYNVPEFVRYKTGVSTELSAELRKLDEGVGPLEARSLSRIGVLNRFSKKYIYEDPFGYLRFHLVKTIPFFVTDGLRDIARSLNLLADAPINFSTLIVRGDFAKIAGFFREGGAAIVLFLLGFVFWILVSFLAFLGVLKGVFRMENARSTILFFAGLILYFALLTGPVSNARYRLPVEGLMLFLASIALAKSSEKNG